MDQTYDRMYFDQCFNLGGVDEVGVTALAGPIVAACVVLPRLNTSTDDLSLFLIDDSKKIREKYREESAKIVRERSLAYGIGAVLPEEIDALGVFSASNLAMKRAISNCKIRFGDRSVDLCLIDGNRDIDLDVSHKLVVKGDLKSLSIAAASILAKVHRDHIMKKYGEMYPEYGFESNKGYKCEKHLSGLDEIGIIIGLHRTSMSPLNKKRNESKQDSARRKKWILKTEKRLSGH